MDGSREHLATLRRELDDLRRRTKEVDGKLRAETSKGVRRDDGNSRRKTGQQSAETGATPSESPALTGVKERVGSKRPAPSSAEEDPNTKRRNRKMFGSLLGTLTKFKKESDAMLQSKRLQRRAELLQKVTDKAEEAKDKTQMHEREDYAKAKEKLVAATALKEVQLFEATAKHQHSLFSKFIQTKAAPQIFWCPVEHNALTEKSLELSREALAGKHEKRLERLAGLRREAAAASAAKEPEQAREPLAEGQKPDSDPKPAGHAAGQGDQGEEGGSNAGKEEDQGMSSLEGNGGEATTANE